MAGHWHPGVMHLQCVKISVILTYRQVISALPHWSCIVSGIVTITMRGDHGKQR